MEKQKGEDKGHISYLEVQSLLNSAIKARIHAKDEVARLELCADLEVVQKLVELGVKEDTIQPILEKIYNNAKQKLKRKIVRILCLDGGGMRGMLELMILEHLQQELDFKVADFDLVAGTSVGGLIALACGLLQIPPSNVKKILEDVGKEVFDHWYIWDWFYTTLFSPLPVPVDGPKGFYHSEKFEQALKKRLEAEGLGDKMKEKMIDYAPSQPKIFVVAATTDKIPHIHVIRTYKEPPAPPSGFPSMDDVKVKGSSDQTVLDAAFATSRAPVFLPTPYLFSDASSQESLVDGGVVYNNPVELAVFEAQRLWPGCQIELILSLGTGLDPNRYLPVVRSPIGWLTTLSELATDSNVIHERFEYARCFLPATSQPHAEYIRIDPTLASKPSLDQISEKDLMLMEASVKAYFNQDRQWKKHKRTLRQIKAQERSQN